jgi:hypothetical protein
VISCKRISEYQIEAYFNHLAKYQLLKLTESVNFPVGVSIEDQSGFLTIVEHKRTSLYEVIHSSVLGK